MKNYGFLLILLFILLAGCSTSASFKLPPDTDLMIKGERVKYEAEKDEKGNPILKTTPFFWDAAADISYSLIKNDKIVKEGKIPAQFRVISIFWPPYGFVYWPFGFRLNCNDLTKDFVEECLPQKNN